MNVAYTCRHCEQRVRVDAPANLNELTCPACHASSPIDSQAFAGTNANDANTVDGQLSGCLVCGCRELFIRKDFSQRLGVSIVVTGIVASTIAWGFHWGYVSYGILFGTALIDLVLYFSVANLLQCYRCQAEYRGLSTLDRFEPFDLETHEKFRQQAIRLAESKLAQSK